jgi:hypothetical protein
MYQVIKHPDVRMTSPSPNSEVKNGEAILSLPNIGCGKLTSFFECEMPYEKGS